MPTPIGLCYFLMVGLTAFSRPVLTLEKHVKFGDEDFTLTGGNARSGNISTRDTALSGCPSLGFNYEYLQISGISGDACIAWESFPNCGNGSWDDPDWTNIQNTMGELVTKGGQLPGSNVGAWNGTLLTAAFSDRDTSLFNFFLAEVDVKTSTIYWSRNNGSAQVTRSPRCF